MVRIAAEPKYRRNRFMRVVKIKMLTPKRNNHLFIAFTYARLIYHGDGYAVVFFYTNGLQDGSGNACCTRKQLVKPLCTLRA